MPIKLNDSLLQDALNRAGIRKQVDSAIILNSFLKILKKIFAEEISEECANEIENDLKPLYIKNKILLMASLNSSLNQEIKLREKTILYRLNSELGCEKVERIVFTV